MTHPVLRRQLRRLGLDSEEPPRDPEKWAALLKRIEAAYATADQERYLLERSFTLSSDEMQDLYGSLRTREAEQAALRRVATAVAADDEPEKISDLVAQEAALLVGADCGRVFRFEDDYGYLAGAWKGDPGLPRVDLSASTVLLSGSTATARVSQSGSSYRVDANSVPKEETDLSLASSSRSEVAAPIRARGQLWGAVTAVSTSTERLPEFAETSFAEFADLVALAISSSEVRTELAHRAMTDPLTKLPNRLLFDDRLQQAIRLRRRDGGRLAVLLMDLDRFKEVNDTLGHGAGDALLRDIADRLSASLRASDTLSRLGGDEFALLLPECQDEEAAMNVASKLRATLAEPFSLDGLMLEVEGSVGVAVYPEHGTTPEALMQHADVAMYLAKERRSGQVAYSPARDDHTPERLALVGELRRAIDQGELLVQFQPKVDLVSGDIFGVEALVRWQHPQRGLLGPDKFIPIAEHSVLIKPLTFYVLDRCLSWCKQWGAEGLRLSASVNISANSLGDISLPAAIADALERVDVSADRLELEITESALMVDPSRSLAVLQELHRLGLRISIDDFGTGYSSLAYLKDLPVDVLKIDRSFVSQMDVSPTDAMIVRSTIELAHNLGLRTVAEGVEEQTHVTELRRLGCDAAQGYLVARPMVGEDVSGWMRSWDPKTLANLEESPAPSC